MKKFMALCLAMLMALSMVSFSVMAEGAATFEDIANGQPAKFVTGNLVLGEHTITSSNEAVIAPDGTVNRPIYEDAIVKVAVDGGNATTVTVKAKTVNALYTNDFSAPLDSAWKLTTPAGNVPTQTQDGVLKVNIGDTTNGRTGNEFYPASSGNGIITMEFDMENIKITGSSGDIRIGGKRYDAEGNEIGSFNTITIARAAANGFGGITNWVSNYGKHTVISYNPLTGEMWGNGKKSVNNLFTCAETNFSYNEGKSAEDCAKVVITSFNFCNAGGGCTLTFDMDNFVYYEAVSAESAAATATAAEKVATYSTYVDEAYITNGRSIDTVTDNLRFAVANLPEGVEIAWSSADTSVIANDGTVKRPLTTTATVAVTGTISIDGEPLFSKTHNVTVLPYTMVFMSETANAENLNVGNLAGVDGWTPSSIKAYEIMEVAQETGNKFFRFSTSNYEPSGSYPKYTFKNVPVYEAGDTIVFEAKFKMPSIPSGGYGTNFEFYLNENQMNEFIYMSGYIYDNDYNTSTNDYHGGGSRQDQKVTAGQWYNLRMEISADPDNTAGATTPTGYMAKSYINDRLVGISRTLAAIPSNITSASFRVKGRKNANDATNPTAPNLIYDIDDIKVYTTRTLAGVLPELSAEERVAYFKGVIEASTFGSAAAGTVFDLDKAYESFDLSESNVSITWVSSNPEYISNEGAVLKGAALGQNVEVDMTATIACGDVTETVTFNFPIAIDGTTVVASKDFEGLTGTEGGGEYVATGDSHGTALHLASAEKTAKFANFTDIQAGGRGDRLVFSADYKFVPGEAYASGGIRLNGYAGAWAFQIQFYYDEKVIGFLTTEALVNGAATGKEVNTSSGVTVPMPEHIIAKGAGEWVNVAIDYSPLSQSYQVYLDGVLLNKIPVLQANMDLGSNTGSAFRGYGIFTSTGAGESWLDNVTLSKYTSADVAEVRAALNAALIDFGSDYVHPVLANCELPAMTIGRSWIKESGYEYDRVLGLDKDGKIAINPDNVTTYKYVTDGPAITWEIDGVAATAINVASPKTVTIKVTATKNGVTMSETFTKNVAPVAIRDLALGTANCLNGLWIEGATGTEKILVGKYLGDTFVDARVYSLADAKHYDAEANNGLVKEMGVSNPKENAEYDQVKIFLVDANGITPLTFMDASLKD